ncbi:hypothetical protein ACFQE8_19215 [Salinirubellus sp. GCM10025818]|uniref:hypothetical protein n=1 Tax=Salinirubellus TaxID=2162630 RepID=UPI0030D15D23
MTDPSGGGRTNGTILVATVAALLTVALAGALTLTSGVGPLDAGPPERGLATATPAPDGDSDDPGGSGGSGGSDGSAGSGGDGGGGGSNDGSDGGASADTPAPPPYGFDVLRTENCGNTCRDVTVRLTNNRDATANDVVVTTRIYAGNSTGEDARVWEGRRDVGTLEPEGSTTATERVSLSYFEALSIKQKGGWITIVTTVESEGITRRFEERRQVA